MSSKKPKPLQVFVAMPGTDLGSDPKWKKPEDVRKLLRKFGTALGKVLGRPVELDFEQEKREAGVIHDSMFRAAWNADVFIADLSGRNPNVFFELGVRYALRRNITLLICQPTTSLPFNIKNLRVVRYREGVDDDPIGQLVEFVENGLSRKHNDSPILATLDLHVMKRELWEKVSGKRRDALLAAAQDEEDLVLRMQLLREAVESDDRSVEARSLLISELRKAKSYPEAIAVAATGIDLEVTRAVYYQERGLCYGKLGEINRAVEDLREAAMMGLSLCFRESPFSTNGGRTSTAKL